MTDKILADLVVLIHLLFIIFVIAGGFLVMRWRLLKWVHIPAFVWGVLISFFGWTCPLTPLEHELRNRAGTAGYDGGFIEHYILGIIYPERMLGDLPASVFIAIGLFVLFVKVWVYWKIYKTH